MRSDFKKLDSFTLETSKNHLIRTFLRNGRLRVNHIISGIPTSQITICNVIKNMISFLVEKLRTEFENYDWGIFQFITIKIKYYEKQLVFEQDSKQYKKFHFKI